MKKQLTENTPRPHDSILQSGSLIFNKGINEIINMSNYNQSWICRVRVIGDILQGYTQLLKAKTITLVV